MKPSQPVILGRLSDGDGSEGMTIRAKTLKPVFLQGVGLFRSFLKEFTEGMNKEHTKDKRNKLNRKWKRYDSKKQREARKLWVEENVKQPLILSRLDMPVILRRY